VADGAPDAAMGEASPVAPREAGFAGAGRGMLRRETATASKFRYVSAHYVSAHPSELGLVSYEILLFMCDRRSV